MHVYVSRNHTQHIYISHNVTIIQIQDVYINQRHIW